jgi:hypothetical protein
MKPVVCINWAPPKLKFFAWLILQNRVWMADRLARHGWPNCGLCQLCQREPENVAHLMFMCRFSPCIRQGLKDGLGLVNLDISQWSSFGTVEAWWGMAGIARVFPHIVPSYRLVDME